MEANNENLKKNSLYLVLSPDFKVEYIRKFESGWLFSFLEQETCRYKNLKAQDVPDNWMVEIRFDDEKRIPPLAEKDNSRYFIDQVMPLRDFETLDIRSKRLRDAVFCERHGIAPLSSQGDHDNLLNHNALKYTQGKEADKLVLEKNCEFPCWKALESERGVLLFSNSENGTLAERKYRQYIVDHFFDPKFSIEFLNVYQVPKFLTHYADYVDLFYDLRIKRAKEREKTTPIPQAFFAPSQLVSAGFCQARFNLMPTGQNFIRFAEGLKVPLESCKLATLMNMAETGHYESVRPEHNQRKQYLMDYEDIELSACFAERSDAECDEEIRQFGKIKLYTEFPEDFRGKEMVFLKEEPPHKLLKIK